MTTRDSSRDNIQPKSTNGTLNSQNISTLWTSLGDNSLAAPDIYGIKQSGTINSISKFANTFLTGIFNAIPGAGDALKKINDGITFFNNAKNTINNGTGIDRLKNISGLIPTKIPGFSEDMMSDLYKKIESASDIAVRAGNTISKLKETNWKDVDSVVDLLDSINKDKDKAYDVLDPKTQGVLVSTLANKLSDFGLKDSIESVMPIIDQFAKESSDDDKTIKATKKELTEYLAKGTIDNLIKNSDYESIKTLSEKTGSNFINTLKSNLLNDLASNYDGKDKLNAYKKYVKTAESIDEKWLKTNRAGEEIINLSKFNNGSDEFKKMLHDGALSDDDVNRKYLVLIKDLNITSVKESLRKHFPYTVWKENTIDA